MKKIKHERLTNDEMTFILLLMDKRKDCTNDLKEKIDMFLDGFLIKFSTVVSVEVDDE